MMSSEYHSARREYLNYTDKGIPLEYLNLGTFLIGYSVIISWCNYVLSMYT